MDVINTCLATTADLRHLALYANFVPAVTSLILAGFVLWKSVNRTKAYVFASFAITFALWLFSNGIIWNANNYYLVASLWTPIDYFELLFFLLLFCFFCLDVFSTIPWWVAASAVVLASVSFFMNIFGYSVSGFDQAWCNMNDSSLLSTYDLVVEMIILVSILAMGIYRIWKSKGNRNEQLRLAMITGSIVLFMGIFSGSEYNASITADYHIELYALFTLPIFMLFLTIAITTYETFRLGDAVAKALFCIFLVFSGAGFFFVTSTTDLVLTTIAFFMTISFGVLLLRSFERESRIRKQVEKLAKDLETANARLKELDQLKSEFLSIASHQLRAPLTAIRGYASLVVQGDYGAIPETMKEPLNRIADSARVMASSIEDYLNISRIEQGRMKYEMAPVALGDLVKKVADELRPVAEQRKLTLNFTPPAEEVTATADVGKIKQVITNLVDNAIKYTEQGSVSLTVEKKEKLARITISDTGIGIAKEEIGALFEKFTRARDANKVNTTGTGLGLYVAKQLVEGHKGKIWIESDGVGKGTRFIVELPL